MHLEPGSHLGPYEITGALGAGGMGEVYRARDPRLGREVAIKVLPPDFSRDERRIARFEREARSASALNHRNIITIHDFGTADGQTWLIMELVRGESLRDALSHGALPMKKLLTIAGGIADGLAAAHAAGIVHRDLKPENVMVTTDGSPKILDFGLVKQVMSNDTSSPTDLHVSSSGVVMGTAGYMSPEQARGEEVDFRTDQFSFGLILYEMATGKNPFQRSTPVDTLAAILHDEAPPLGEPLGWIVERCLQKNRAERYGSTSDLAHDLRRLTGAPTPVSARLDKRVRAPWWALAVALAAIAIAIVLAIRKRTPPATPSLQAAIPTPEIAQVFRDEIALPVALSPTGEFLVVYGTDVDANPDLWLYNLRTGASRQIAENAFAVGFSGDGKSIAYFADGKLKTLPVDGGPGRVLCDAKPEGPPTWSGDTILYVQYSTPEIGIYRVSADGGKPQIAVPRQRSPVGIPFWPEFLPDGKHFLYLQIVWPGKEVEHELWIGSLDGSPPKKVQLAIDSRAVYASGNLLFVRDGTLLAQPFDPDKGAVTGEAKPIVDRVHYFANTGLAAFAVSQNGVLAWRVARPRSRLAWVDRTGIEVRPIANGVFNPAGRISPDGHRYAAAIVDPKQGSADIWIYDLDRDSSERLTFKAVDEIAPIWAPNGRSIYYRGDGNGGPPDIFRLNLGEDRETLVYSGPGVEEPHDVSRDGKWMLFVDHRQAGAADIYALPLDRPGKPRPFAVNPFNEQSPRFSPDGHWVAYESNASGRPEIYVRAFEGSELATRISKDGGTRPRWKDDGKELFFVGPAGRLMSAAMNGGISTATPRMLFQSSDVVEFEPAPDGSRFLVQLEERTSDPSVHLLVNWQSRLAGRQ